MVKYRDVKRVYILAVHFLKYSERVIHDPFTNMIFFFNHQRGELATCSLSSSY